jgi:hypothetical protein
LSYWWYGGTYDEICFDYQDAYVTDTNGNILARIQHACNRDLTWESQTFDMTPYAGQTVRIEFLVHQDGFGDDTYMYVDDVTLGGACPTGTPTVPPTSTPTVHPTNTTTSPPSRTVIEITATSVEATATSVEPTATSVEATATLPEVTVTVTPCTITFSDVPPGSTFYAYIHCLACLHIVSGYPDGTFKPNNKVTRGQLSKIVANAAFLTEPPGAQMFQDVRPGSTFYDYVQRLAMHGYMSGYACGGPGEPCGPGNLPYFRPDGNATRGQTAKIVSNAAGFSDTPSGQQFEDVAPNSAFYPYIYRLSTRNIVQGYTCGGPGEPCGPGNLPYFRPDANGTRGQTAKIVSNTFFPGCSQVSGER